MWCLCRPSSRRRRPSTRSCRMLLCTRAWRILQVLMSVCVWCRCERCWSFVLLENRMQVVGIIFICNYATLWVWDLKVVFVLAIIIMYQIYVALHCCFVLLQPVWLSGTGVLALTDPPWWVFKAFLWTLQSLKSKDSTIEEGAFVL